MRQTLERNSAAMWCEGCEQLEMPKNKWVIYKLMYRGFAPHRKHSNRTNKIGKYVEMMENNPHIIWQTV